jgi:hypothetical protein
MIDARVLTGDELDARPDTPIAVEHDGRVVEYLTAEQGASLVNALRLACIGARHVRPRPQARLPYVDA